MHVVEYTLQPVATQLQHVVQHYCAS